MTDDTGQRHWFRKAASRVFEPAAHDRTERTAMASSGAVVPAPTRGDRLRGVTGQFLAFMADIRAKLGWRGPTLAACFLLTGILEGLGLTLLFPLLSRLGIGEAVPDSGIGAMVTSVLNSLGIGTELPALLALIIFAFVLQNTAFLLQSHFSADGQARYTAQWRTHLFGQFMAAEWLFFSREKSGVLLNALITETNRVSFAFNLVVQLAALAVFIAVYLCLAFAASWPVAASLVVFGAVMFLASRALVRRGQAKGEALSAASADFQSQAGEFLGGAKLIKASATETDAQRRLDATIGELNHLGHWISFHPNLLKAIYEIAGITALCATLGLGLVVFELDPAGLLVAVVLFVRMYARLATFQQTLQTLRIYLPSYLTIREIFERAGRAGEPHRRGEAPGAAASGAHGTEAGAHIVLAGVSAGYGQGDILKAVSLEAPAGRMVAIVGESGAGKSTLVDCLLELVRPSAGGILVDGEPLDHLAPRAWRRAVGYVSQDTFLFHASVRDNLRWGNPDATDAALVEAARRAHAHGFISALPQGYDTLIGDRGVRLSGGQRQRLGLARALVTPRRLLLLDEPTSALDSESETLVLDTLREIRGQVTLIIVAHRLSTVRDAEVIYVLDAGRVIESGSWTELLEADGRFAALWALQNGSGMDKTQWTSRPAPASS